MKPNEIGHFPFRKAAHQFDHDDYASQEMVWIGDKITWIPRFITLGAIPVIDMPQTPEDPDPILIYDLQTANDAYCASKFWCNTPEVFVWLQGSGWRDLGFPWNEPTFDPQEPLEHSEGKYAFLRGKAARNFIKIIEAEKHIPTFMDVFTGDVTKDFCLDKQYVDEMSKEPPTNPKKVRLFGSQFAMEDFLQEHKVFINGINNRRETCHMDSYGTIVDFQALELALKELENICQATADDWKPLVKGWLGNYNCQMPCRLVALTIAHKYGLETKALQKA